MERDHRIPSLDTPDEGRSRSSSFELKEMKGESTPIPTVNESASTDHPLSPRSMRRALSSHVSSRQLAIGSLLYAASTGEQVPIMNMLNHGEININDSDYDHRTALHVAAAEGHIDLVKSLLKQGASVNAKDRWGGTALDDATRHGHDQVAAYLRANGAAYGDKSNFGGELIHAAHKGELDTVKRLLESGVSPNSVDYDKRSALHIAVAERHLDVVKYLLESGANPNLQDRFGATPMDEAKRSGVRIGEDDIAEIMEKHAVNHESFWHKFGPFAITLILMQALFIILFAIFIEYSDEADGTLLPIDGQPIVTQLYPFFTDVHVMIFIGFGFLMTFLRKYGYTAVGLNFLLGAFCIQWYLLVGGFWENVIFGHWEYLHVSIFHLIKADFCTGAVLITFGAVLGKTTPLQMIVIAFMEVIVFSINEAVSLKLAIADLGGSLVIHAFGAYFGLALSWIITPAGAKGNNDNAAVYRSDMFAMIGTIFLWMYWPSFNGALGLGATQHRAIVNTLLSLCASCVTAFVASYVIRGERQFNMVDIQNATLAGGVAMGAAADMVLHPAVALGIGCFSGIVSVWGFSKLQPFLERKMGLHDTCGVHNLHGMPGLIGAIAAISAAAWAPYSAYSEQLYQVFPDRDVRSASKQASLQFAFLCITMGFALVGGAVTGLIVKSLSKQIKYFVDDEFWEVPKLEIPYYFDERGEIIRIDKEIKKQHKLDQKNEHDVAHDDVRRNLEARIDALEAKIRKMASHTPQRHATFSPSVDRHSIEHHQPRSPSVVSSVNSSFSHPPPQPTQDQTALVAGLLQTINVLAGQIAVPKSPVPEKKND